MKFKALIFTILIYVQLNAQKDIKIVKIDNSHYPDVELTIKTNSGFDSLKLKIKENNESIKFKITDIELNEYADERRYLFLFEKDFPSGIRNLMQTEINAVKKQDKINIGIIYKQVKGKEQIYFVSPEFSKNIYFFKNFVENYSPQILYPFSHKQQTKISDYLFAENQSFAKFGIIFIGNSANYRFSFLKRLKNIPFYVLQINNISKEEEDKVIKICMNSGGIYTSEKDEKKFRSVIERYKEDISLSFSPEKITNLKRISFHLNSGKRETEISVKYNNFYKSYKIFKPEKNVLTHKEIYLTIFSSVLLVLVILLLISLRKEHQKRKILSSRISKKITENFAKPIEINLKGSGLNKTYFFEKHLIRIGRNPENDVSIPDPTVSGNHAIINKQGTDFVIQDLGSTNGIIINKKKVKKQVLKPGDKIKLGGVVMFVRF